MLLHWPNPHVPLAETLGALAHARRMGLARHIGVSNFTVALIEETVALCPEPLVCNQVEYHPYLGQGAVKHACERHGMAMTAYSPLGRSALLADATLLTGGWFGPGQLVGRTAEDTERRGVREYDRTGRVAHDHAARHRVIDRREIALLPGHHRSRPVPPRDRDVGDASRRLPACGVEGVSGLMSRKY